MNSQRRYQQPLPAIILQPVQNGCILTIDCLAGTKLVFNQIDDSTNQESLINWLRDYFKQNEDGPPT